ncbi:MAG TPA: hypothetical protein VGO68_08560 [Pyrinomonadaceae bacterium]|jgi:hypothetical protein|nr:hypothetical protein [Pyrinomonadaceae bacterium]
MRNMNCRNIRREIETAGSARFLSKATIAHLDTCPACETISRQQTNLQTIVSSLGTVEAPKDFDYRLRARLAAEKRGASGWLMRGGLSFGFRSAAVAAMLLLIGAAFIFVTFRSQPTNQLANGSQGLPKPAITSPESKPIEPTAKVSTGSDELATVKKNQLPPVDGNLPSKRLQQGPDVRREVATRRNLKRVGTYDEAQSVAQSLTPDDAFPINTSNQSLKVSVDNRRGAKRTISLPSVSFGSQRTLSQSSSPLLASSRDTW